MGNIDLPAWVGLIAALFVIVAAASGAVSIAWSKTTTTRQGLLEANNKTLDERVKILEDELARERADHKTELARKDEALKGMMEKVAVLEKVVTGREQLEHLTALLVAHDQRVDGFMLAQERGEHDAGARHEDLMGILVANKRILNQVLEAVT